MIASNRVEVEGPRYAAPERSVGVNKSNLISLLRAPQLLNHHQRQQPLKFVLLNVRSIRKKTLLLRDYIVEHGIDLLAITKRGSLMILWTNSTVVTSVLKGTRSSTYQGIMPTVEGLLLVYRF